MSFFDKLNKDSLNLLYFDFIVGKISHYFIFNYTKIKRNRLILQCLKKQTQPKIVKNVTTKYKFANYMAMIYVTLHFGN